MRSPSGRYRPTPRRSAAASTSSEIAGRGGTAKTPGSTPWSSWFVLILHSLPANHFGWYYFENTCATAERQGRDAKIGCENGPVEIQLISLYDMKRNEFRSTDASHHAQIHPRPRSRHHVQPGDRLRSRRPDRGLRPAGVPADPAGPGHRGARPRGDLVVATGNGPRRPWPRRRWRPAIWPPSA